MITAIRTLHLDTSDFYQPLSDTTTGSSTPSDGYAKVSDNNHTTGTTEMTGTDATPGPTTRKEHKLKIMTLQCCSLRSTGKPLDYNASLLDEHQPDIVCGAESHLDTTDPQIGLPTLSTYNNLDEALQKIPQPKETLSTVIVTGYFNVGGLVRHCGRKLPRFT